MKYAQMPRFLALPKDAKRPLRVSLCQRSVPPVPDAKTGVLSEECGSAKSLEELVCEVARVQGQAAGKEEDSENQRRRRASTSAEVRTGGVWTTTPPFAHAGRPLDVSRWKVRRIAPGAKSCEDNRSATESSKRS